MSKAYEKKAILFGIIGVIIILLLIRIFYGNAGKRTESATLLKPVVPVEVYIAAILQRFISSQPSALYVPMKVWIL